MKTIANKLIIAATVVLFVVSVNAQNTKSVRMNHFAGYFSGIVSEKVKTFGNSINEDLRLLESVVRFKPLLVNELPDLTEPVSGMEMVTKELEKTIRYSPSQFYYEATGFNSDMEELGKIRADLESVVKFQPAQSVVSENAGMEKILKDLEKEVKYTPSAVM